MKWQKERDDLIAQTKAFVQSVTGRTPQIVLGPIFNKPTPTENPFVTPVPVPESPSPLPIHVVAAGRSEAAPVQPAELMIDPQPVRPTSGDVRKEIQSRVAAFQAHQHRFHRERDAYFNSVLGKARTRTEDGPETPSA